MSRRPKATGFTRFLIAMIFVVPIAYLVASYANGEDGIQNIKDAIGGGTTSTIEKTDRVVEDNTCKDLQEQIKEKNRTIEQLQKENARLKEQMVN